MSIFYLHILLYIIQKNRGFAPWLRDHIKNNFLSMGDLTRVFPTIIAVTRLNQQSPHNTFLIPLNPERIEYPYLKNNNCYMEVHK